MTELEVWRLDLNQRISTKYLLQILSDIIEFGLYLCVMGEKICIFRFIIKFHFESIGKSM